MNTIDKQIINTENYFEKKWIQVVIIGIIFIVVVIFFIFICRWRSAIIKQNSIQSSSKRSKQISIPHSQTQPTQSIAYSNDKINRKFKYCGK